MKTMKNVLMILLGAALVLSLAGVGAADEQEIEWSATDTQTGALRVTYTIGESCSFTIPTEVTPSNTETPTSATFSVDSAILGSNSMLVVKITSSNGWKMKLDENTVIPYTMNYDDADDDVETPVNVNKDSNVVTVTICKVTKSITTDEEKISKSLSFKVDNPDNLPNVAGPYTDTLTFTVTSTSTT